MCQWYRNVFVGEGNNGQVDPRILRLRGSPSQMLRFSTS